MQRIAKQPEQLTVAPAALPRRVLGNSCGECGGQRVASARMQRQPLFDCAGIGDQPLSPMLGRVHEGSVGAVAQVITLEGETDRLSIGVAHQPADVLNLSPQPFSGTYRLCQPDRIEQPLVQGELFQFLLGKVEKLRPQGLQRMAVAL